MNTTRIVDEVKDGKHFLHLKASMPVLKSVLATKRVVKNSFFIDGVQVDEHTFLTLYKLGENRINRLIDKSVATMEEFKATQNINVAALDEIEAELTPAERKIQEKMVRRFPYEGVQPHELRDFLSRLTALSATLSRSIQERSKALLSAKTTI